MADAKGIVEIRIHGRGGQGAKSASQLIVEAAMDQGKQVQAFPEYGPERSGAPMVTYARISDKRITTYEPVLRPDIVMVIDPTLLEQVDVTNGMTGKSILIVNTNKKAAEIRNEAGFAGKTYAVDATGISIRKIGRNLPNTPMLGALIKVTGVISLESLIEKVEKMFLHKIGKEKTQANIDAIKEAYEKVA
ncbi:MAG: 2-oxoacid:acceptor oxidoreductase family protein [Candidatus Aenigmarchaeota archaeon]|nr:2-oxoacid:acceptor oxidoreductase family protein [Candidatus Aenigmarchaeota archaeon]